ncbi:hypothetical protein [Mycobacteroides chelonae]|uniref:hypothetical protein n=1 Tax=Mycobacteroides chelonae TaxID=1774 RepID=UPI0008AA4CD1|nr:hypothetical protein [Mycobacteroides chelonae]OHT54097.1 hypothetical protein BKG63_07430 [Mycobacteroides chelonae]OHT99870.1 hypothetical protein BKG72_05745 [Mycobacteroides chelonae]OLT86556.1 hypothetical protein BKG59_22410 [Mycobacteroides chelonae]
MAAQAPIPTQTDIEKAILSLLPADGTLMAWRDIRPQTPGGFWSQAQALDHLHESFKVTVVKVRGRNYVRRASDWDRTAAAAQRARLQAIHPLLGRSNCRDFSMA